MVTHSHTVLWHECSVWTSITTGQHWVSYNWQHTTHLQAVKPVFWFYLFGRNRSDKCLLVSHCTAHSGLRHGYYSLLRHHHNWERDKYLHQDNVLCIFASPCYCCKEMNQVQKVWNFSSHQTNRDKYFVIQSISTLFIRQIRHSSHCLQWIKTYVHPVTEVLESHHDHAHVLVIFKTQNSFH